MYITPSNQLNQPNNKSPLVDKNGMINADWVKWFNNIQVAVSSFNSIIFRSSVPSNAVDGSFTKGTVIINTDASASGDPFGWYCTQSGVAGSTAVFLQIALLI